MSMDGTRRSAMDVLKERYGTLSAIAVAVGILLVLVSELTDAEWTRVFGALAITFGGIGLGIRAGLSERAQLLRRPLNRGTAGNIALVAGALMGLPGVIALVSGLGGGLDGAGGASGIAQSASRDARRLLPSAGQRGSPRSRPRNHMKNGWA